MISRPGTPEESRVGRELLVPPDIYQLWGPQITYIAQLELLVFLAVMIECAQLLRGTHGLWFTDNTAALMALVSGRSDLHSLDTMARFVHVGAFALHLAPYFEYVESAANWVDEISRQGLAGSWARDQGFALGVCTFVPALLDLSPSVLARVFSFL